MTEAPQPRSSTHAAPRFTWRQRLLLPVIAWVGSALVRLLCGTVRYEVSFESTDPQDCYLRPAIWAFWHSCLLLAAYRYRNRNIVVLTSQSFDGECISRILEKLGFSVIRGSSRRGGAVAIRAAHRSIENGEAIAFTPDGPLGPPRIVKPGAVLLSAITQCRIFPFYIAVERAWRLQTWDRMIIPKPFSRAVVHFSAPILVPASARTAGIEEYVSQLQASLEHVREVTEKVVCDPPMQAATPGKR